METNEEYAPKQKMSQLQKDGLVKGVTGLWNEIAGSTRFALDKFLLMISSSHDNNHDFLMNHSGVWYRVPFQLLDEYFRTHAKPTRSLSLKEENTKLKTELSAMKALLEKIRDGEAVEIPEKVGSSAVMDFMVSYQGDRKRMVANKKSLIDSKLREYAGDVDMEDIEDSMKIPDDTPTIDDVPTQAEIEEARSRPPTTIEEAQRDIQEQIKKSTRKPIPMNRPIKSK